MHISGTIIELIKIQQAYWKVYTLMDSEGGGRDVPPQKKRKKEKRERGGDQSLRLKLSKFLQICLFPDVV